MAEPNDRKQNLQSKEDSLIDEKDLKADDGDSTDTEAFSKKKIFRADANEAAASDEDLDAEAGDEASPDIDDDETGADEADELPAKKKSASAKTAKPAEQWRCPSCGKTVAKSERICPVCGTKRTLKKPAVKNGKPVVNKKKAGAKKKDNAKGPRTIVINPSTIILYIVAIIAIFAIVALVLNAAFPEIFRKVFYNTPLDRNGMVMQVGNYKIMAEEYRTLVLPGKQVAEETYGVDYWLRNPSADKEFVSSFQNYIIMYYCQLIWADELGVTLTDAEKQEIDTKIQTYIDETLGGSHDEFLRVLNEHYYTEAEFYRAKYNDARIEKLYDAFDASPDGTVTPEQMKAYADERGVMSAKHILFLTDATMTETEIAAKKTLAENVLQRIRNGEDFDTLMNKYSEDPGLESYPDGYDFENGEMVSEFYNACKALEPGEVSDLVKSDYGYHIVMRMETDYETFSKHDTYEDTIISNRISDKLVSLREHVKVTYGFGYKNISVVDITWEFKYPTRDAVPELPDLSIKDEAETDEEAAGDGTDDTAGDETNDETADTEAAA